MKFSELEPAVQESIVELLNHHLQTSADILKKDRCLLPMLMIPDSNRLFGFQSKDANTDVDKAYAIAVEKLKQEAFTYALFSYSTQVGLQSGAVSDAIKTCVFTANGIEVSFYTPYAVKGLFKKTVNMEKSILSEVKENIFG